MKRELGGGYTFYGAQKQYDRGRNPKKKDRESKKIGSQGQEVKDDRKARATCLEVSILSERRAPH